MKCSICECEKFINTTPERPFKVCATCEAMERHRALWNLIKDGIVQDAKILDISPISKYIFSGYLKKHRPDVTYTGVDKYRNGNPKDKRDSAFCDMYFDLVDMPKFIEDGVFDLVIMQHVIEEIDDYKTCLKNISNVLKKEGKAFLEIPSYDYLFEHVKQPPNNYGNVWQFSKGALFYELKELFEEVEVVNYEEGGFIGNFFVCKK